MFNLLSANGKMVGPAQWQIPRPLRQVDVQRRPQQPEGEDQEEEEEEAREKGQQQRRPHANHRRKRGKGEKKVQSRRICFGFCFLGNIHTFSQKIILFYF